MPKVSILIPTYNQAAFIVDAVRSALSQNYPNLEVVVGDDFSEDDTQRLLKQFNDTRLKIVRNDRNLGRVANYRSLLRNYATGDYVVNLDGDDYYTDSNFIAKAAAVLDMNADAVIVSARVATKAGQSIRLSSPPPAGFLPGSELLRRLPAAEYHLMHLSCLYRRQPAIELDFYRSGAISSDWESLYRLACRGKIYFLSDVVGIWRIHAINESQSVELSKHIENLGIWTSIYAEAERHGLSRTLSSILAAKCEAYFALSSCIRIAERAPLVSLRLIISLWEVRRLAALFLLFRPASFLRLLLCAFGFYRRRAKI